MALISCPECNHRISDQALKCPNCGCPRSKFIIPQPQLCPECGHPIQPEDNTCPNCGCPKAKIDEFTQNKDTNQASISNTQATSESSDFSTNTIGYIALVGLAVIGIYVFSSVFSFSDSHSSSKSYSSSNRQYEQQASRENDSKICGNWKSDTYSTSGSFAYSYERIVFNSNGSGYIQFIDVSSAGQRRGNPTSFSWYNIGNDIYITCDGQTSKEYVYKSHFDMVDVRGTKWYRE